MKLGSGSNEVLMAEKPLGRGNAVLFTSPDTVASAPFVLIQPNADGWSPAEEGSWPRNSDDHTSAEPPLRVAIARSADPRSEAATM